MKTRRLSPPKWAARTLVLTAIIVAVQNYANAQTYNNGLLHNNSGTIEGVADGASQTNPAVYIVTNQTSATTLYTWNVSGTPDSSTPTPVDIPVFSKSLTAYGSTDTTGVLLINDHDNGSDSGFSGITINTNGIGLSGNDTTTFYGLRYDLNGGSTAFSGTLNVNGAVSVSNSGGTAIGLDLGDISAATLTITGTITAEAAGDATGISVEGGSLSLSNNVIARSTGGAAVAINATGTDITLNTAARDFTVEGGIRFTAGGDLTIQGANTFTNGGVSFDVAGATGSTAVNFDTNVTLMGSGSFTNVSVFTVAAGKDVNLGYSDLTDIANGITITSDGVFYTDGDVDVTGQSLSIDGSGRTELMGDITAAATGVAAGSVLAVDGSKLIGGRLGTVDNDGTIEVYGNAAVGSTINNGLSGAGNVISKASFVEWGVDGSDIKVLRVRASALMSDNYLAAMSMHHRYTAWNAVRDHAISGNAQSRHGYLGQSPEACEPVCGPVKKKRAAWVNYVGRDSSYRNSFTEDDWCISSDGVQAGTEIFRTCRNQLGLLFGYEGQTAVDAWDSVKADDIYFGAYGVHVFRNGADARAVFNYGWQNYDSVRYEGADVYTAGFKGNTVELNLELGKRRYAGAWSARPLIGFDLFSNDLHGAQESAGAGSVTYDKANYTQAFFRFGTDLRYELNRFALTSGLYYSYDMKGGDLWSGVSSGPFHTALQGSRLGRSVLSYNFGGSMLIGKHCSVFGGFNGETVTDRDGDGFHSTGYVGGAWKW
jgi:hypothetical protein